MHCLVDSRKHTSNAASAFERVAMVRRYKLNEIEFQDVRYRAVKEYGVYASGKTKGGHE